MTLALWDVRVIALEQYGAGPFGTLHLADLGAEIIKVEDPRGGGDVGRYVPPHAEGESSLFFETFNRNKKSISLDISTERGREVFDDLVRVSDVVFSNLRGDLPQRLRLRYADLAELNPRIVCCALTGFGQTGPRRDQAGYDYLLQGLAGWMSAAGEPHGAPTKTGFSTVDYSGGFVAALSVLAGVHAARRDGVGGDCDVSLYDTAIGMIGYPATWYERDGREPTRIPHSAHPSLVPFQNFPTADGWIVVACPKEKFFRRLCTALGRGDVADDPRFADFAQRREHRDDLVSLLEAEFAAKESAHWLELLTGQGVPCAPVQTVGQALADPHTAARGDLVETDTPTWGRVRAPASPARFGMGRQQHRAAPRRGQHTDDICTELLGYDQETIARLAKGGAFGEQG